MSHFIALTSFDPLNKHRYSSCSCLVYLIIYFKFVVGVLLEKGIVGRAAIPKALQCLWHCFQTIFR